VTHHHGHGLPVPTAVLLGLLVIGALAYVGAARRGPWPAGRTARWLLGIVAAAAGLVGPEVIATHQHDLRAHMAGHLLLGMAAPLLLVWGAPVTLALRTLPGRRARALSRLLRASPVAVATHPAVAGLLDTGGMWVLYRTDLYAAAAARPTLLALVHVHMLAAGYLFAFSLTGPDPAPHRAPLGVRAGVLILAVAAHDVLAKLLYAAAPATGDAAQLMYYAAAPVHVALFVLLGREWAAGQRRARRRAGLVIAVTGADRAPVRFPPLSG
jgi:putative membrane protein